LVGLTYGVTAEFVLEPRVTTPPGVMLPGVAVVCAEAGRAANTETSIAQRTNHFIRSKRTRVEA
jgi:hypothetical protein